MKRMLIILAIICLSGLSAAADSFSEPFRIIRLYPFYTDAVLGWNADKTAEAYEVNYNGTLLKVTEPSVHLRHLPMDTGFTVTVTKLRGEERGGTATTSFRTGKIAPFAPADHDYNAGPTHVTFEFSDVSGGSMGSWPCLGEAYEIQLFDKASANGRPVYSFYSYDGQLVAAGVFSISGIAGKASGTAIEHPLRVSIGRLKPDTPYWVRIRSVQSVQVMNYYYRKVVDGKTVSNTEDYDPQPIVISAPRGASDWSELIALRTEKAHVPEEGELLYEGFDDMSFGPDYFNVARGIVPQYKTRASSKTMRVAEVGENPFNWSGSWGLCGFAGDLPLSEWGASVRGKFPSGRTSYTNTQGTNFNNLVLGKEAGSLYNWSMNWWPYPAMGVIMLPGHPTSKSATSYLATPEIRKGLSRKGSKCLLRFKMCPYMQTTPDRLIIEQYNSDVDKVQYIGSVTFENIVTSKTDYSLVEANCWQNVEAELTLYPYDCVIIYNASSSNILVDEISITKL